MSSNSDERTLERRLAAVERAVDERELEASTASDPADATESTNQPSRDGRSLNNRLETLENRVDELDAALQAVRGFLGGIQAVNEAVESRADAAIAAVERLERRLDEANPERVETDQSARHNESPESGPEFAVDGPEPTNSTEHTEGMTEETERTLRERLSEQW